MQPTPDSATILLPPVPRGYIRVLASGAIYDIPTRSMQAAREAEPTLVVMSVAPPQE